jgi:hypothetical protein
MSALASCQARPIGKFNAALLTHTVKYVLHDVTQVYVTDRCYADLHVDILVNQ